MKIDERIAYYHGCIDCLQKQNKKYLSINDASILLKTRKQYFYEIINSGKVKFIKLSSRIMLNVDSLLGFYQKIIEKNSPKIGQNKKIS